MRISDWSSDVCSSDLQEAGMADEGDAHAVRRGGRQPQGGLLQQRGGAGSHGTEAGCGGLQWGKQQKTGQQKLCGNRETDPGLTSWEQTGKEARRERVCQ